MKQKLFLLLALFIAGITSMNAQVRIGNSTNPHPAAVLDLKSTETEGKGLLLPKVELTNLNAFLNISASADEKLAAEGMIVYCPGTYLDAAGLYLWDGSKWILLIATAKLN